MTDMSHAPCKIGPLEVWLCVDDSLAELNQRLLIIINIINVITL